MYKLIILDGKHGWTKNTFKTYQFSINIISIFGEKTIKKFIAQKTVFINTLNRTDEQSRINYVNKTTSIELNTKNVGKMNRKMYEIPFRWK